jgi:glyceraldehyde-3-phosphate dehydrogenase (NADP+)
MLLGATRPAGTDVIEVRDPEDGSLVGTVPRATLHDLDHALDRAVEGSRISRALPVHERVSILRAAAEIVMDRREAFAETIAREGIKTIREARREVMRCAETLRISAEEARRVTGETIAFDQRPGSEDRVGYWIREPVGVIAAITPFNDPLNLVAHKVGPAIASGNAIIVKPHSATPLSALGLADVLLSAGLPPTILQIITGRGEEIGDALVGDRRVSMVSFTGGPAVGDRLVARAGRKKIALELGANSPNIVLHDADLDAAADAIVDGAFGAAGQNCLHVQRVIVERAVEGPLTEALVSRTSRLRRGPKLDEATDLGPLISRAAADRVRAVIADATLGSGEMVVGGAGDGTFVEPTLVREVPLGSRLAREEVFGPVTGIFAVDSLDEAIRLANAADQALHAAVFTNDIRSAMRVVREVAAGGVIVNDSSDYRIDAMPFGGVKGSGMGREGVAHAIAEMTTTKVVCLNLTPARDGEQPVERSGPS